MKRWLFAVVFAGVVRSLSAQGNLVPNPSFEFHTSCPNGSATVNYAVPWVEFYSADYYDTCATHPYFDVPSNWFGYQNAFDGSAYCGLITFSKTASPNFNHREFIQVRLLDTLEAGYKYCIKFYANVADTSQNACSSLGTHFSASPINNITTWTGSSYTINYNAQAENDGVLNSLNDTSQWHEVQFFYQAAGNELYLTIGNFQTDSNSIWQDLQNGSGYEYTYVYIDEVSVIELVEAYAGLDSSICAGDSVLIGNPLANNISYSWQPLSGLSDSTSATPWARPMVSTTYYLTISDTGNLYCTGNLVDSVTITVQDCTPIPPLNIPTLVKGDEIFFITSLPANSSLKIYDTRGRLILREDNYQNDFSVINLDASVYLYELTLPDLTVQKGKFCVVR